MDASEMEALFAKALVGEYDDDAPWEAVSALRRDGSRETFEKARSWLSSDDPLKRARASAILAQLRQLEEISSSGFEPKWMFREETYELLAKMLEDENAPLVINSVVAALGHLYINSAIPLIVRYENHPDEDVRCSVACALGHFPNDPISVDSLIRLTSDNDSDVRDWAVFGLGVQGDVDTPEIREAIYRCLSDTDEDVREEAAVGLGKRRDQRLLPKLREMLATPELKLRVAEAASALLGLDNDPPEWMAADYLAALDEKFGPGE